jgi:hypothetical protein
MTLQKRGSVQFKQSQKNQMQMEYRSVMVFTGSSSASAASTSSFEAFAFCTAHETHKGQLARLSQRPLLTPFGAHVNLFQAYLQLP